MNQDFVEMLSALSETGTEFLVVGAPALAVHARPRATGDLNPWLRATPENAWQWQCGATLSGCLHSKGQ